MYTYMYIYIYMIKITFISSLPFFIVFVSCLVFPICDDHQILSVSRCGDSRWSWCW